jgi:hypothetical protein
LDRPNGNGNRQDYDNHSSDTGRLLTGLWKNLSPFFLLVTSGFGTWDIAEGYLSRYAEVPPPTGQHDELIFYLSLV